MKMRKGWYMHRVYRRCRPCISNWQNHPVVKIIRKRSPKADVLLDERPAHAHGLHHAHRIEKLSEDPAYKRVVKIEQENRRKNIRKGRVVSICAEVDEEKKRFVLYSVGGIVVPIGEIKGYLMPTKQKKYSAKGDEFLVPDFDDAGKLRGLFICSNEKNGNAQTETAVGNVLKHNIAVMKESFRFYLKKIKEQG